MFAQMFFKRSDIKYQILNVKINFAPNIETIKIKPGFFPDNICTYLTIYSLENIIDIYVQTPNMLAFFHAFMNTTQTEISKLKAESSKWDCNILFRGHSITTWTWFCLI